MNPDATHAAASAPKKEHFLWDLVKFIAGALVIVFVIRTFVAQPFIVSGLSMWPTFQDRDYLVVDELSYRFARPARGDVLVFHHPGDMVDYIKRIIGLPGEKLIANQGVISVYPSASSTKGTVLDEPYLASDHRGYDSWSVVLGPTEYWVMGDNRTESSDSRTWGPLGRNYFIGRPLLRLLPFGSIGAFPGKQNQ